MTGPKIGILAFHKTPVREPVWIEWEDFDGLHSPAGVQMQLKEGTILAFKGQHVVWDGVSALYATDRVDKLADIEVVIGKIGDYPGPPQLHMHVRNGWAETVFSFSESS